MTNQINTGIASPARKPLLIHIGYHKTGSTWLQKLIFQPKNGFFQPFKLRELYDSIVLPNALAFGCSAAALSLEGRLSSISGCDLIPVLSHERLGGDPFTGSRDAKEIAERLHAGFPDARILIVVREQFELIASLYKTYILHGGKARLDEFIQPKCDEVNQWFDYNTYCYDKLINYYVELFGREHLFVVIYEELKADNQAFYGDLCEFMGMPRRSLETEARAKVNSGLSEFGTEMLRWVNLAFGIFGAYPLGMTNNKFWLASRAAIFRVEWITKRFSPKGRFKQRTKKILFGKFKESNAILHTHASSGMGNAGYEF